MVEGIWSECVSVTCTDLDTTPEEAYEEAMMKIFDHGAEVHRFSMPNLSRKQPSKARWTLFEMWPINVSSPALLALLHSCFGVTKGAASTPGHKCRQLRPVMHL